MKKCTKCKEDKSRSEFIKLSGGQRHSMCDPCRKAYTKEQNRKWKKAKLW